MRRFLSLLSLFLLVAGAAAFYFLPFFWRDEPLLVFKLGLGTVIFIVLFFVGLFIQLFLFVLEHGEQAAVHRVAGERDESHRQFLRRLDHELKNPLTGLQAALTNLRETGSDFEKTQAIENASLAALRLGRILRDLRKLSDLDEQMLEHLPVDMGDLVNEMVAAACSLPVYQGRSVQVMISKVPVLPQVTGDRDLLGLALYNLIDNALKFTGPQDAIEVRVHEDGHFLFIEVADSGKGILAVEQERVFEDLYRGENASETEGSGLGLALARRIVYLHGGDLFLRSDPDRQRGTIFTIRLAVQR
ncbi:MAG: HAMP domain-containing histidine kinase [Anaerolineae bacterium]|nr:HAMP domain-containing histidine kinase [Anaerolineae bacterium]